METGNIETSDKEIALLKFIEGKTMGERRARSVTENIKSMKDLWLLAKMAKDAQSVDKKSCV